MGKISDIWVRLGLKKNEFDRGMDDAAKKSEKTGSKMTNMLSKVKAGWLAIGTAVIAFGREMVQATNRVGDAWNNTLAGVKAGWQSALADISNYKPDFSSVRNFWKNEWKWIKGLFSNAGEAYDAGKAMAQAFDAEFELENSLKVQRAKISGELVFAVQIVFKLGNSGVEHIANSNAGNLQEGDLAVHNHLRRRNVLPHIELL